MSSSLIVHPKNDQQLFEYFEDIYNSEDRYRRIDPSEAYGSVQSVQTVLDGSRPIAWIGSAQFPKGMKEFLQRFLDLTVLTRQEYDPDDEIVTIYWDKSYVPVTVSEKWVIGRRGTQHLQKAFQEIKHNDLYFHQKVGHALSYDESKIREWCLTYKFPYQDRSKL